MGGGKEKGEDGKKGGGDLAVLGRGLGRGGWGRGEVAIGWVGVQEAYDCSGPVPQVNNGQFRGVGCAVEKMLNCLGLDSTLHACGVVGNTDPGAVVRQSRRETRSEL